MKSIPSNAPRPDVGGVAALSDDDMLALIQAKARKLDRQIRFRDWRETIAAGLGILLIAPMAVHASPLKRVGVAVVIAGLLLIVVTLARARRAPRAGLDLPVTTRLRAERTRIDAQVELLENVLSWYVGPIAVGTVLMVIGDGPPWWISACYTALMAVFSWGLFQLNRRAARNYLRPRRDEVAALLSRLESAPDAEN